MLDHYTIDYILSYYGRFATNNESAAMIHYEATQELKSRRLEDSSIISQLIKKRLTTDQEVLQLLNDGYQSLRLRIAQRILNEHQSDIYFNYCPKCKKIARSPQAKQCRFCYYSWHDKVIGTFQISSAFQLTGRGFYILGDLLSGKVRPNDRADLTVLGLAIKPKIIAVEYALHVNQEDRWEDTGLHIEDISELDKEHIKTKSPFVTPILIEEGNGS
jgi:hypothetical protein